MTIAVRSNDRELIEQALQRLPPGMRARAADKVDAVISLRVDDETPPHQARVYLGAREVSCSERREQTLEAVESALRFSVALHCTSYTFVHAGCVLLHGRALAIPGPSFSGKSTLVDALVAAGATYMSDEYALLAADGLVYPYRKAIRLRNGQTPALVPAELPFAQDRGVSLGWVLETTFQADSQIRRHRVSTGSLALALMANTVRARLDPKGTMAHISAALHSAIGWSSTRGDATETVQQLLRWTDMSGKDGLRAAQTIIH